MNKMELVTAIAEKTGITKKQVAQVIDTEIAEISATLAKGEKVVLVGFGTFDTRERTARTGKNPRTGEAVKIDACKVPAFKAGKALKDQVNG